MTDYCDSRQKWWTYDGGKIPRCHLRHSLRDQHWQGASRLCIHDDNCSSLQGRTGRPDEMERPIMSFTGFPSNSGKFEIKRYIEETVLPMLFQKQREEVDGEPFGPGRFRESMWLRLRAGQRSRQNVWSSQGDGALTAQHQGLSQAGLARGSKESAVHLRNQGGGGTVARV